MTAAEFTRTPLGQFVKMATLNGDLDPDWAEFDEFDPPDHMVKGDFWDSPDGLAILTKTGQEYDYDRGWDYEPATVKLIPKSVLNLLQKL